MDTDSVAKFKYRGSTFCQCFVNHFCQIVDRYTKTISYGRKDKGPVNELVNGLGLVIGGATGAAASALLAPAGLVIATATAVNAGGTIASFGTNYLHNKFSYYGKAKNVVRFVDKGINQQFEFFDPVKQRRLLVHVLIEAALHIFEMFEYQFMKIAEANIQRNLEKLAYDAACRVVNYITEHSCDLLSASVLIKGIPQGISKKSKLAKITFTALGQEGHTVTTDTGSEWNTAKLFSDVAVKAVDCVYVKDKLDESMGTRLPAGLTDFEPCETDEQLQRWLIENGYKKHNWEAAGEPYIKVASNELLSEIGEHAIQHFEGMDLELRFDKIDQRLIELMEISERNAIRSSTAPSRKISFKPITEPHVVFTGRDDFIESAVEYLTSTPSQSEATSAQIQFRCLVIHAPGGYGKSQTAKKIASICRKNRKFQHFIWIDSENDINIGSCFFAAIKQVALVQSNENFDPANIDLLLHKFYDLLVGRQNERFLIIFDNVEDFDRIRDYLPLNYAATNISVLMTSQRQCQMGESYGSVRNQQLGLILPDEAKELVEKVLGIYSLDSEEEKELLVERSGMIPLVLHVMSSTIKFQRKTEAGYRIAQYLTVITDEPLKKKDEYNRLDICYKKSFMEAIQDVIAKLKAINDPIARIAVQFFDRVVYCSPTGNQISFFVKLYLQDILKEANNVDLDLPIKSDGFQVIQMAIELLSEFSLIQRSGDIFTVHRSIQESRRLDLKRSGCEKIILQKLMSNCPYATMGHMPDHQNTLSIWLHVADYADLTNEFYPKKGSLSGFMMKKATDVIKKVIEFDGIISIGDIISEWIFCPMEEAIESGNKEMIDLFAQTILKHKADSPEQFLRWSDQINRMLLKHIHGSALKLHMLKHLASALDIDLSKKSESFITACYNSKFDLYK